MQFGIWIETKLKPLIIPVGTTLFHGSIEPFKSSDLNTGGYDSILWTATEPYIAQSYIPVSGSISYISPNDLVAPSQNPSIIALQKKVGIFYDLNGVTWQQNGRAESWYRPRKQDGSEWENLDGNQVNQLLLKLGFKPKHDSGGYSLYAIRMSGNKILPPNTRQRGRLFVISVEKPLEIYDTTDSENIEPDLMEPQYHNHKLFREIESLGFDGIKIGDHAQSHDMGNVSHFSIGIFKHALTKLKWETIQARHPDIEAIRKNPNWDTEEYLNWKNNHDLKKNV